MKLLLDQNLSFRLLEQLEKTFPGSAQVRLIGMAEANDFGIWRHAKDYGFTIVTKDSDFYEISLIRGFPPKVIWLKCGNISNQHLLAMLQRHEDKMIAFSRDRATACLELY